MAMLCPPRTTATCIHHLLFCSLLLFLSCCVRNAVQVCDARVVRPGFQAVTVSSLLPGDKCSGGGSRGLPITQIYGPCSKTSRPQPTSPHEMSGFESSFFNQQGGGSKQVSEDQGNFLVEVGFGTPPQKFELLLDSGSSTTWTQCKSCVSCTKGTSHFNSSASATYSFGSCIPNTDTDFTVWYADKSSSTGHYGCDTLTLESDVFPKFQFGCGIENKGNFGERVDGVLGLGPGASSSLLSQTASKYKKVFSYCLPTEGSIGSLLFGDDAMSQSSSLHFTSLVNPGSSDHYSVKLLDISVADMQLNIPISGSTVVDSGTVVTRLPQSAYSALRDAFKELMSGYTPSNTLEDNKILDTCYNLSDFSGNDQVTLPKIALHFDGGTDLVLNGKGILWGENAASLCLAFAASEDGQTILGNAQQLSRTVLYDIPRERIGFGDTGSCGK